MRLVLLFRKALKLSSVFMSDDLYNDIIRLRGRGTRHGAAGGSGRGRQGEGGQLELGGQWPQ